MTDAPIRFFVLPCCVLVFIAAWGGGTVRADIGFDAAARTWSLRSGPAEYRLGEQKGAVVLRYFGPTGGRDWPEPQPRLHPYHRFDQGGQVDGQPLSPENLELIAHDIAEIAPGRSQLTLTFRHRHLPLEVREDYATWGDTGVFTQIATLTNRGAQALALESSPSLCWLLPPGEYTLDYLHGGWGEERQLATEKLGEGRRSFVNRTGRSSNGYSPWFCVGDSATGIRYAAQLAYSGNWQMAFEHFSERRLIPLGEQDLNVELGMRHDFGGAARLEPGASFELPSVAITAARGDLDQTANQLHRYQRRYVIPAMPAGAPLITQFNSWEALGRYATLSELKPYVDLAAELGLEAFGPDAAWVVKSGRKTLFGDWRPDPSGFPHGNRELADYVHSKGLKFCLWLEPESTSKFAPFARQHPDWILQFNGVPMEGTFDRVYWDFRRPEVRAWARAAVDRLVREDQIDWLKIDYNADVGERFDPADAGRSGSVLYEHERAFSAWLAAIRRDYPELIIENCSSGSLRENLALAAQTHFGWLSDVTAPRSSVQLAYGGTIEFAPEICFHWMKGDGLQGSGDRSASPGWWDFMFRVPMNGPWGISSRALEWSSAVKRQAAANVALFKRIRPLIAGADTYHLTPPPAAGEHPTGWSAVQYAAPNHQSALLMAYRLGASEAERTFRLRGLTPNASYVLTEDGRQTGISTGRELSERGLKIHAEAEWRARVIELRAQN